jgi:FixJ family two-component response regulator
MSDAGTVYLVEDEPGMLKALSRLLGAAGFKVSGFHSAADFLKHFPEDAIGCLVLDVAMPGMDGMELQRRLNESGNLIPIVFLTGHGDIPMSVRAIKSGAVDFLTKPVHDEKLLAAVRSALQLAGVLAAKRAATCKLRERLARLTPRELDVMRQVITGKLNKQIAAALGTGEQNIKVHRMRMMQKMAVESVAELVRAAERLGVEPMEH